MIAVTANSCTLFCFKLSPKSIRSGGGGVTLLVVLMTAVLVLNCGGAPAYLQELCVPVENNVLLSASTGCIHMSRVDIINRIDVLHSMGPQYGAVYREYHAVPSTLCDRSLSLNMFPGAAAAECIFSVSDEHHPAPLWRFCYCDTVYECHDLVVELLFTSAAYTNYLIVRVLQSL